MGHDRLETTQRYTHVAQKDLKRIRSPPDRRLLGVFLVDSSKLMGAVEVKLRYPSGGCVSIGSMLFQPGWREKGLGTETLREIERRAMGDWGAIRLEIAVSEYENVVPFLEKHGFQRTERRKIDRREAEPFEVIVWERHLQAEE